MLTFGFGNDLHISLSWFVFVSLHHCCFGRVSRFAITTQATLQSIETCSEVSFNPGFPWTCRGWWCVISVSWNLLIQVLYWDADETTLHGQQCSLDPGPDTCLLCILFSIPLRINISSAFCSLFVPQVRVIICVYHTELPWLEWRHLDVFCHYHVWLMYAVLALFLPNFLLCKVISLLLTNYKR